MATIQVSAAIVRKYYNNPSVCGSWRETIREEFDLYTGQEVFDVDSSFIEDAYAEADSVLKAELKADFPSVFVSASSASGVHLAQPFPLAPVAVMAGVEVAGNSAKNSKLPEAVGKGIFLDGNYEFLIRKTKKGNYLIVPVVKDGAGAPDKFKKLSGLL